MIESTITDEKMLEIYKEIGKNVKAIRTKKGVSQLALAMAIGHKAVGTISMAEICLNKKHFNIEHLHKIAEVLEVDVCEFFQKKVHINI
jgi:transcriptional regulator with XRE-family HTH domain